MISFLQDKGYDYKSPQKILNDDEESLVRKNFAVKNQPVNVETKKEVKAETTADKEEKKAEAAEKEEALCRIYAQRKEWPGEMNMLFINFNYPAENRMVPPNLALVRLNCK